ncbi:hypothetical protein D3C81_1931320 [compost metagenome]
MHDTALHGLLAWMLRSGMPTLAMPKPSEYEANTDHSSLMRQIAPKLGMLAL